jgi:hypothetical protein
MDTVLNWGDRWSPINEDGSPHALELAKELVPGHPLHGVEALVFGRCLACDDIVAAVPFLPGDPELVVIHLTWKGSAEDKQWPHFERVTTPAFLARFVESGEHL